MKQWWQGSGRRWLFASGCPTDMPGWVYIVQVAWAAVLLAVFLAFVGSSDRLGLPASYGRVPVEAPWLGAVGGLLASFGGIVYYARGRWDPRFNYWHPMKPLMAGATGGAACLLVIVLFNATAGGSSHTVDPTTLDAAAFIFGFAESSFRQLVNAVTDIFLKPGSASTQPGQANADPVPLTPSSGLPTTRSEAPPPAPSPAPEEHTSADT